MSSGTYVGFGFYNIGIQNTEVAGQNWEMKVNLLKDDIHRILSADLVDCVFLSEFGNMFDSINAVFHSLQKDPARLASAGSHRAGGRQAGDSSQKVFAKLLQRLG